MHGDQIWDHVSRKDNLWMEYQNRLWTRIGMYSFESLEDEWNKQIVIYQHLCSCGSAYVPTLLNFMILIWKWGYGTTPTPHENTYQLIIIEHYGILYPNFSTLMSDSLTPHDNTYQLITIEHYKILHPNFSTLMADSLTSMNRSL